MTPFGKYLKHRLRELGMTQRELAEKAGVNLTTVENWIGGRTSPRVSNLAALAEALKTTTQKLVKEEGR